MKAITRLDRGHAPKALRLGLAVAFFCSIGTTAMAGSNSGADFLKIPIGARAVGLGQAMSALSDGVDALNWNPAGMASLANGQNRLMDLSLSHQALFEGNNLDHVAFAMPLSVPLKRTAWGFSITRLSYPDQERRDVNRQVIGSVSASDLAAGAAVAVNLGRFKIGTQGKYIRQDLAGLSAEGMAMDVGAAADLPVRGLSVGAAVRNMGPQMRFLQEAFRLPLTVSAGAAYSLKSPLTFALDVHARPYQNQVSLSMGTEYSPVPSVALRAGYLARLAEAIVNNQLSETNRGNSMGVNGIAMGLGFRYKQFVLDYAISPFGELGNVQNITLATRFGGKSMGTDDWSASRRGRHAHDLDPADFDSPLATRVAFRVLLPSPEESWWLKLKP